MMYYCPESMPIIFTNEMAQGTKTDLNKKSSTVEMIIKTSILRAHYNQKLKSPW